MLFGKTWVSILKILQISQGQSVGNMQSFLMLKQVVRIKTCVFERVATVSLNNCDNEYYPLEIVG
jgi:hypothetical protein